VNLARSLGRLVQTVVSLSPRRAVAALTCAMSLSVLEGAGLLLLIPLLQLVGLDANQGTMGRIGGGVGRVLAGAGVPLSLGVVLLMYVAVSALQSVLQRWHANLTVAVRQDVLTKVRTRTYRAIAGAEWAFFVRNRASMFTHVLTDEVDRTGDAAYYLLDLLATIAIAAAYVALAVRVSPAMTSVVLFCGAVLVWATRGATRTATQSGEAYSSATGRLYSAISEHLGSMKATKSFGSEDRHAEVFAQASGDVDAVGRELTRTSARMRQRVTIGSAAVLAAVVYVSHAWLAVPAAALFLLLFLFARLMPRVMSIPERLQLIATLLPALAAVCELEARCHEAAEPAAAQARDLLLTRDVTFDDVTLAYHGGGDAPAVDGVSLTIPAGTTTAIVGASGAGKTTLADLLMGLLTPASGRVLVDGQPLGPEHLRAWRAQIGYVPQDTFLFHDTVRANLLWARPDAADADLRRALRMAAATSFVDALPDGLDTVIGDRGIRLSGGERQRLSLARALLRDPKLLILDEATSSLDFENERHIHNAIAQLHRRVTIVIITHRLSTIRGADRIYVMDRGRVAESGTWADLNLRQVVNG
jgi:ATP-binding cassette subfamily C protein